MDLSIKLYGVLSEIVGKDQLTFSTDHPLSPSEIIERAIAEYPEMKLVQIKVALNQKLTEVGKCSEKDEIALLPPFAGG